MTKSLVLAALGRWPGLDPAERYEGHDLAVTTDFRDLFGEVVSAWAPAHWTRSSRVGSRTPPAPGAFKT
jgi:uncharacterized protein (DUF1501 family)